MEKRRVVITGMGVVSPVGIGTEEFWNALMAGKSGIRKDSLCASPAKSRILML